MRFTSGVNNSRDSRSGSPDVIYLKSPLRCFGGFSKSRCESDLRGGEMNFDSRINKVESKAQSLEGEIARLKEDLKDAETFN